MAEFVKLADVKIKKTFMDEIKKLQSDVDKSMGKESIDLLALIEDSLPNLVIEIDNYRAKEVVINGGVPVTNDKGKSYLNADSLFNAQERYAKAASFNQEFADRMEKDRRFGKIGELQVRVDL